MPNAKPAETRVGIISDTHGLLRPEAIDALQGSDLILHAGDIGKSDVLEQLSTIAPVVAVRGNNDKGDWANKIPEQETITVSEVPIHILHIRTEFAPAPTAPTPQVVISGHSHKPAIEKVGGILFINPGSAGPRRFKLPVSVAHLVINGAIVRAQIVELTI